MMRALLDVNALLALFDPKHVHHTRLRQWWGLNREHGWASCPLTQNGFLRIASQKAYANPIPLADALARLSRATQSPLHAFWPDDVSLLDAGVFEHARVLTPRQLTDIYLLALAVEQGGRLVTLDRGITPAAVRAATTTHLVVV